jgi:Family of unknown function (DUF5677)
MKNTISEISVEIINNMLSPRVDISGLEHEKDHRKLDGVVFELYKETLSVVNLAAHLLSEADGVKGGWSRNQAICAGLLIRVSKFMLVVIELAADGNRAEVVHALNRSILESAVNLEFLVRTKDDKFCEQFVKFSLAPERELYDLIQENITARQGQVLPIEQRMMDSINNVCKVSGVKIEDIDRKSGDWGGGTRERLKAIKKEKTYAIVQRIPSHAVHGTWVDLYKNHLEYVDKTDVYAPRPSFAWVDARLLGPVAIFVLDSVRPYLERFFAQMENFVMVKEKLADLEERIIKAEQIHERLFAKA